MTPSDISGRDSDHQQEASSPASSMGKVPLVSDNIIQALAQAVATQLAAKGAGVRGSHSAEQSEKGETREHRVESNVAQAEWAACKKVSDMDFDDEHHRNFVENVLYKHRKNHVVLDMGSLQRTSLQYLQREIAVSAFRLLDQKNFSSSEILHKLIPAFKQYVEALRDFEYMDKCVAAPERGKVDPFVVSSTDSFQRVWLQYSMQLSREGNTQPVPSDCEEVFKILSDLAESAKEVSGESIKQESRSLFARVWEGMGFETTRREQSDFRAIINRIRKGMLAAVGSSCIVLPMMLMTLQSTTAEASVQIAGYCILLFAFISTFCFGTLGEMISATAAYAAVIVVFVGIQGS